MRQVVGNLVDIHTKEIYAAIVSVANGVIIEIDKTHEKYSGYILPGLIDAHVHIESSLLSPIQFAHAAVRHGTVATVSDPHEIANVLGIEGVRFMIENGKTVPFKFHWCAPSCVPATVFETAGGSVSAEDIAQLLDYPEVVALAEMMNFPGVVFDDEEVMQKLTVARDKNFPIDGHAPGLVGRELVKYVQAGITTDHECTTYAEAIEKMDAGMKILVRNGSSAKNFKALAELVDRFPDKVMLCCDDIHADDLLTGHINAILKLGVGMGLNVFNLVRAATINVAEHYRLRCGMLRVGDRADFCIVRDLRDFEVTETWIDGVCVYKDGLVSLSTLVGTFPVNRFEAERLTVADVQITNTFKDFKVISVIDGELLTREFVSKNVYGDPFLASDVNNDILKIVVVNRYTKSKPAVAFVKNFGLKRGAFASSVAHDSHNIIAVGVGDADLVAAINALVESKGGLVAVNGDEIIHLPLPIAGLMSDQPAEVVSAKYTELKHAVREMGSELSSPFMTLSFMALLVIPELKLSDKGLFDGRKFEFTPLFV